MFNKTMIALATVAIVGSATAALSYEDPEYKIGDRYPALDQSTPMARNIGAPYVAGRSTVTWNQAPVEDPEYRLADRYPNLGATVPSVSAARVLAARYATASVTGTTIEDPEYRIGDRYPFLDRAPASPRAVSTARLRQKKHKA